MKKSALLLLLCLGFVIVSVAQTEPRGMKYQAVARNLKGEVMANEKIALRISLSSMQNGKPVVHYSEIHSQLTNELGLFSLVIGEGEKPSSDFAKIPWSTEEIWMEVAIQERGSNGFATISNSKLLAVPYAFHAVTASKLVEGMETNAGSPGVPSNVWSLKGNYNSNPLFDKLGTTDYVDLVFITNNTERLRITKDGNINISNNLDIGNNLTINNNVDIGNDLTVKKNVYLNTLGGTTVNNGPFNVTNNSATGLSGTLTVGKATNLNDALNVNNMSPTVLSGTLRVDKAAVFKETITADGAVDFNSTLNVDGAATINNSLLVTKNEGSHVATFKNTNNGNGDGIKIQLGKTHPTWNGSAYANVPNPVTQGVETQVNQIRDWIYGNDSFSWDDLINLMPSQYLTGTICNLTNYISTKINEGIGLPYNISTPINNALGLPYNLAAPINNALGLPYTIAGETVIPAIPSLTLPAIPSLTLPAIPQLNCTGLPSLSFPVFEFDNVDNSLTNENEFVTFVDKDNRKLGSIRAQSIEDFSYNYFDGQKLLDLASEFIGIDIVDDFMSIVSGISEMVGAYNSIGVEYTSGNGDYAEWLERAEHTESISYGDIVGVKGGKITKDINGAEQIMAVSKKPIVLGNMPDKAKIKLGNNIAFMGQIPVKVMGPVTSGDYIVAKADVPGYGIAVHPKDMTVQDYKLSVGRSWDTNKKEGPKMVNTVVGVHNNDFLNIISGLQQKASQTDERLKAIESALNIKSTTTTKEPVKKAFK